MIRKLKSNVRILYFAVLFFSLFGLSAYSTEIKSVSYSNNIFSINYTAGKVKYVAMKFTNPNRLVFDFRNITKCKVCDKPIIIRSNGSVARMNLHTKKSNDIIYKKYKEPTLRVVFSFKDNVLLSYKIVDNKKGLVKIIFGSNATKVSAEKVQYKKENILERISYRKFKTYEMVVALLKSKPEYAVKKMTDKIKLVVRNAKPTKAALKYQNLSALSSNIKSINPEYNDDVISFIISLKKSSVFRRYYSDKRHIYLIFNIHNNKKNIDKLVEKAAIMNESTVNKPKPLKRYTGDKISFDVRDADIKDVLRILAQVSKLNFITSDDVHGRLTMKLVDVPWDQVLDIVMQQKGLVAEREGNIIRITTAQKMQSEKQQELRAMEDKLELDRAKRAQTEIIDLNYITPDYAINIINNLIYKKKSKSGFIVSDVKNNALICHDTKTNIEKVKNIVKAIDARKKAVEINARIVEISKTFERSFGIQWGGNYAELYNNTYLGVGGTSSPATIDSAGNSMISNFQPDNFLVNLPATVGGMEHIPTVSLAMGNLLANYNLDLKLTAGEIEGYSKVISSPHVITLDNEPAKIKSGQEIPYQESAGSSGATSTSFKEAALSLEVTPHITNNRQVILKIKVTKDSADFAHTVNGEPPLNTNEVDSTVVLRDGQTVVLGGLMQKTNSKTTNGIPGLMRIPFFGWLFKSKRISHPENELFIFVTPKIVYDDNVNKK